MLASSRPASVGCTPCWVRRTSCAIAAATTIGYLDSFSGPPALGALAQVTNLSTALISLVVVSAVLGVLARPVLRRPAHNA